MTWRREAWHPSWTLTFLLLALAYQTTITSAASPTFTNIATDMSTTVPLLETAAVDSVVFTASATDTDAGDTLTYSLVSPNAIFKMLGQQVQVKATSDFDAGQTSYSVTVRVYDGTNNVDGTFTVTIVNVNDETPVITPPTVSTVLEEQIPGTAVTTTGLTATDGDLTSATPLVGEQLYYSLSGSDSGSFNVDSTTGVITTAVKLNREAKSVYNQLVYKVTDSASPPHTATISITVTVTDINDVTPTCSPSVYYVTLPENTGSGTSLVTLTCTDGDDGVNGVFNPTIAIGDPGSMFTVSAGLQLQTGTTAADYETGQSHTVVIHLVDTPVSGSANTGTATVVVTVSGVNDNNPAWGTWVPSSVFTGGSITVSEDAAVGISLFTVVATDGDFGSGGTIVYSLDTVTDSNSATAVGVFRMDPVSGKVSTVRTLDRDSGVTSYSLTVKADDGGGSALTKVITVTLSDVNDNSPSFTSSSYQATLAESASTTGASLVQMAATDADASATYTYSIDSVVLGNSASKFRLSASISGLLELAGDLDLDTAGVKAYSVLRVLVTDGGTPPRTGTASVTVSITPTNDHIPVFGTPTPSTSPIAVTESTAIGTSVVTVPATDSDVGSDGVITYSITGGNDNNAFTIISTTGEIRTLNTLDYESEKQYSLQVTATDSGGTPKSATTTVSITITNENDNTPTCTNYYVSATVAENAATNAPVTSLTCSDADGDPLTYTITTGNADGKFAINAGAITLANTVNYDSATQSYTLQVTVSDGPNSQTVTVKVIVTPVNDGPPSFATNPTMTVSESQPAGYVVTTYTATDADYAPHDVTSYAITAVTQSGSTKFTIDQSSGAISLLSPLDYEALPTGTKFYLLTITATDGGSLKATGTVTVSVQDINDNPPSCSQSSWSVNIQESVSSFPHTVVTSLGCSDAESATSALTFTLTESPAKSLFAVSSGGVTLTGGLDYEATTFHLVTVVVTDGATPALSTTIIVNVFVQNVNDGPPVFTGPFAVDRAENVAVGTSVADVTASDPDGLTSALGNPQYSITGGDPDQHFNIDAVSGRVTTRALLDVETKNQYLLQIRALEQGGANSATTTLTVTVTDVNDVTPSCNANTFVETVPESSAVNHNVLTLTCTDSDVTSSSLKYSISSGDTAKFKMTANVLQLAATLDYESGTTQYSLTITVSDGTNSLQIKGSVLVGPVNEHPPVFSAGTYSASKSENLAVDSTIVQVTATDADSSTTSHGVVVYAFSTPHSLFTINSATGAIVLTSSLDREGLAASYNLLVTASDGDTTSTATVSLTVTDENDNPPIFTSATYTASVSETATSGAVVVTVTATDADDAGTNGNGAVTYVTTIGGDTNNHFAIDTNSGAITTTTQLNADAIASYTLTITATDRAGDASALTSTTIVIVTVTSVNQHTPVFTMSTYTKNVDESLAVGSQVIQVIASDADTGNDGTVTYSMTTHAKFSLAADGWISVKTALDFETTPNTYVLQVLAIDGGTTAKTGTTSVSIVVGDVNDNTALCNPSLITVTKREDATGAVTSLACTDADSGTNANLVYAIVSVNGVSGSGAFAVDASGAVTVTSLDFETATSLNVVIRVADQGSTPETTSVLLTVLVTDVNEHAPTFSGTPLAANVAENAPVGHTVKTVTASDNDGSDVIRYSLSDTTRLLVDSVSGKITLKSQFDFESSPTYTVNVCATDSNTVTAVKSTCQTLTVTVTDVNDNDPVFTPSVYSASVQENAANGLTVVSVTATDADSLAAGGTVSYSLVSGNTNNVFRVDPNAGHIIIDDNSLLDFETTTSFGLTVRTADGGSKTADAIVTITVTALNEHVPTFTPTSSTQTVAENAAVPSSIITLTASDTDAGNDGTVTYSISSGAAGKFSINPSTGEVKLVSGLDRETTEQYQLTILAVDGGTTPGAKTGTYSLTIDVTDVNDVTPSCTSTLYAATVAENAAVSEVVKDVTCSDGDKDPAGLNNALSFSIASGNTGGVFSVSTAGRLSVAVATFDRETKASYSLTLHVVDKASTGKLTATVTVTVDVTDINDNSPVFSADPYSPSVPENSALGHTAVVVAATDADAGYNAAVTYSLTSATPSGKFSVDPNTGAVTVASALDFETVDKYVLAVTATDQGFPPRAQSATVSVTVTNVDDIPPVCAQSLYTASLAEDTNPATATVVTVSCPDADSASVTYTLTNALFAVHPSTGVVSLTGALDYETAQSHTLTVTASDGTHSVTTSVRVTVTDVNESPPVFDPTIPYTATVPENAPIGTTVKDIGATDADLSDTTLTYSISTGNAAGKFSMDSVSGVIVLQGVLDRESGTTSYTLQLQVADGTGAGSKTATTSIVVTVTDVNDNDPSCPQTSYSVTVAENSNAVMTLACSDVDASTPTVRYTLLAAGNTGPAFGIGPTTGVLTVVGAVDYETAPNTYSLLVEVDDQDSTVSARRTTTVPITVTITPVNEATPTFPGAGYPNTDVIESAAVGSQVIIVSATDTDTGLHHGTVRYSIVGGNSQGDFIIDASTGKITVAKPLDREGGVSSYTLTVRAADDVAGSANEKTADVSVGITLTDNNDNYPTFSPATYHTTIQETASVSGTVLTVTVTDADTGPNAAVAVSIKSGNTGNTFSLSGSHLVLANQLDYETTKAYDLVLEAVDGGSPPLTSQARVSILVGAVNEDAPVLTDSVFAATIPEDKALGSLIYTATATDTDQDGNNDGVITFSITAGDTTPNSFIVDPNSGQLRVFSRLDFDSPPQTYTLTLTATDGGGKTDTVTLTLTLSDVNDHTPQFPATPYTTSLDENVATSTSVITVAATDSDSGVNGQVSYSITDGNGQTKFAIDSSTGVVTTTSAIDYEATPILYLVVKAADGGTPPLSSTTLLRINVVDLNDNPPVVVPDNFAVILSEDVVVGTQVTTVGATDADSAANNNNVVVFSLTSAKFTVHPSTGAITTTAILDREASPSGYVLEVKATDQGTTPGQNTATATVTVVLTDVNDNDPVITGTYDKTIAEDTAVGLIISDITATDADIGDNGRLTYTITSGNTNTDFKMIATNGMLQVAKALDRETTASYTLTIKVADNGAVTVRTATVTASITISDINDNDPTFTGTPYAFTVAENSPLQTLVGTLVATDKDSGVNANLVFSIQTFWTGHASHFVLDAATGKLDVAVASLDRETTDTYTIWCRVHDQGTPQRHADVNVTVTVTDVNDNPPVFSVTSYTASLAESSPVGTTVLQLQATDADIGTNGAITFSIDKSTAAGTKADTYLQVGDTSGQITVKASVDYETDKTFIFEVKAKDGGSPPLKATATVTVSVTDVNDNNPAFVSTFINSEVAYGGQCSNAVAQPVCQDADSGVNGQVACYLVAGVYDYLFAVDGPTCAVTTQTIAAANGLYVVDVQCRDAGAPVLIAAIPATVRVDTFIPDNIIVTFQLSINRADFVARQATFMTDIAALVKVTYPQAILRLWCIEEREGTATSPATSGRRRLLQSAKPVDVMVYAIQDASSEAKSNVGQTKAFLTNDQLMAFFAANAAGTPSSSVTGSSWDAYGIEKIKTYVEESTPWIRTPVGIAVVAVGCFLGLILLCLVLWLIVRCCCKRKRPITPVRAVLVTPHDSLPSSPPVDTSKPRTWSAGVPDVDKSKKPAIGLTGLSTAAIAASAFAAYNQRKAERTADQEKKESVASPRTILLSERDEDEHYPVTNREFDGRALDPETGKVYEYSTKTHQRRWLDSPPGYNV